MSLWFSKNRFRVWFRVLSSRGSQHAFGSRKSSSCLFSWILLPCESVLCLSKNRFRVWFRRLSSREKERPVGDVVLESRLGVCFRGLIFQSSRFFVPRKIVSCLISWVVFPWLVTFSKVVFVSVFVGRVDCLSPEEIVFGFGFMGCLPMIVNVPSILGVVVLVSVFVGYPPICIGSLSLKKSFSCAVSWVVFPWFVTSLWFSKVVSVSVFVGCPFRRIGLCSSENRFRVWFRGLSFHGW